MVTGLCPRAFSRSQDSKVQPTDQSFTRIQKRIVFSKTPRLEIQVCAFHAKPLRGLDLQRNGFCEIVRESGQVREVRDEPRLRILRPGCSGCSRGLGHARRAGGCSEGNRRYLQTRLWQRGKSESIAPRRSCSASDRRARGPLRRLVPWHDGARRFDSGIRSRAEAI